MSRAVLLFAAVTALAACSDGAEPTPSGATCPPGNTLTYENFAAPFMTSYCTRCHASNLEGPARHGAPLFHDFDTKTGILNVGGHVDEWAAAGPLSVNTIMPEGAPKPTLEERQQLGAWIACELDALAHPPDAGLDAP